MTHNSNTSKRGMASMNDEAQHDIASKGGTASNSATQGHRKSSNAGKKGDSMNMGNFANDTKKASDAGKIGGSR